jgi:hypothetical protein
MLYQTRITEDCKLQKTYSLLILFIFLSCWNWTYIFHDLVSSDGSRRSFSLVMAYVPTTTTTTTTTRTWPSYKKGPILPSRKPSACRISRYKTISLHSIHTSEADGTNQQKLPRSPPTFSSFRQRLNYVLTGQTIPEQPIWIQSDSILKRILPGSIMNLRPSIQLVMTLLLYMFHTLVLAQHSIPFPFQLMPNERGNFQSIGLDS